MSRLGDFPAPMASMSRPGSSGSVSLFTPDAVPGRTLEGFDVKRRGKLTYYTSKGDARPVLSAVVTEEQADGDLRVYLSGLTGGFSAYNTLGLAELAAMDPEQEVPLVFQSWERWLQLAGICESIRDIDFIEMHAFAGQPKSPSPLVDPVGYAAEAQRLRAAYSTA
jgi:hypothetical protein|eukprot:COSAG06_NODE_15_length_35009_cov_18.895417_3_plen_166_part_00